MPTVCWWRGGSQAGGAAATAAALQAVGGWFADMPEETVPSPSSSPGTGRTGSSLGGDQPEVEEEEEEEESESSGGVPKGIAVPKLKLCFSMS